MITVLLQHSSTNNDVTTCAIFSYIRKTNSWLFQRSPQHWHARTILCTEQILYVIDQTRGRVFHQDIQTPRSVLKNEAVGGVFKQLRGVWISWWNTLPSVWSSISNKSAFKEKIEMKVGLILSKRFITYPNSVSVLISFVFSSWIINDMRWIYTHLVQFAWTH